MTPTDDDRPLTAWLGRHDPLVLLAAMALFAAGAFAYRVATSPEATRFDRHGLQFDMPDVAWLPERQVEPPPLRLMHGVLPSQARQQARQHTMHTSAADPQLRLEIRITVRPQFSNLRAVLSFTRRARYGELYREYEPRQVEFNGKRWLRTRFSYATKPHKHAGPRVATGIELATLNGKLLYVVTAHGTTESARWLAERIETSLAVDPNVDGAGTTADHRASARVFDEPPRQRHGKVVRAGLPATVMVMAVDLIGGRLRPVSGGSGVVITSDGFVLTNYHVIHDEKQDRLHDFFVIGRYREDRRDPELICAGEAAGAELKRSRDLALIRCDRNLDGHAWSPKHWPTLPFSLSERVQLADKVHVLGYPRQRGGGIATTSGNILALAGPDTPHLRVSAAITDGLSGGPVIEDSGRLVGIAAASHASGGLAIPIAQAVDLIVLTRQFESEGAGRVGVAVAGSIVDIANGKPIHNGIALVLKEGIDARDLDLNQLRTDVLAWGITDEEGRFTLSRLLPRGSSYTAIFWAPGYAAVPPKRLRIDTSGSRQVQPWPVIQLRRR